MRLTSLVFAVLALSLTQMGTAQERGAAYNDVLKRSTLSSDAGGKEIQIREAVFEPGWKAPRHYHNSDLFIYVISGEFEVDMEGEGLNIYTSGQALRMKPNTPMDARNPSDTTPLKLAVFQVDNPDAAFVVPIAPDE